MERTIKRVTAPAPIAPSNFVNEENTEGSGSRWRKIGGGTFRMASGRIIKPNQIFTAEEYEIPKGFKHLIVAVDPADDLRDVELKIAESKYTLQSGSPGWYNVLDSQGKIVNEKQLRQADAQELVESLS